LARWVKVFHFHSRLGPINIHIYSF
jgi:hypothetical protein